MLVQSYGAEQLLREKRLRDRLGLSMNECNVLCGMIHRRVNSPLTSSVGRLFDAVAALVLGVHRVGFEGEAAIQLQAAADRKVYNAYDLGIVHEASPEIGSRADWAPMLMTIVNDCFDGVESGVIAARFHNALANWAGAVAASQALYDVVVSGGCFLNELLTDRVVEAVRASGRRAYTHSVIPAGDGGIAAGQLAIALCA
jgi:hydrogenase maturation protein HypF